MPAANCDASDRWPNDSSRSKVVISSKLSPAVSGMTRLYQTTENRARPANVPNTIGGPTHSKMIGKDTRIRPDTTRFTVTLMLCALPLLPELYTSEGMSHAMGAPISKESMNPEIMKIKKCQCHFCTKPTARLNRHTNCIRPPAMRSGRRPTLSRRGTEISSPMSLATPTGRAQRSWVLVDVTPAPLRIIGVNKIAASDPVICCRIESPKVMCNARRMLFVRGKSTWE
mmetsp:Transcript_11344/g.21765  ORF Transcript_11344/g.21765 Transcript_11344/m.21765 type:complete len:228 (+) Transcript_11344:633-1316(+)